MREPLARKKKENLLRQILVSPYTLLALSGYFGLCLLQVHQGQAEFLGSMGNLVGSALMSVLGTGAWFFPLVTGYVAFVKIKDRKMSSLDQYRLAGLIFIASAIFGSSGMGGAIGNSVWGILESVLGRPISLLLLLLVFAFCLSPREVKKWISLTIGYLRSALSGSSAPPSPSGDESKKDENKNNDLGSDEKPVGGSEHSGGDKVAGGERGSQDISRPPEPVKEPDQKDRPQPVPAPVPEYGDERPNIDFLRPSDEENRDEEELKESSARLVAALKQFGVKADVDETVVGPMVATHFVAPKRGTKISEVERHLPDISRFLGHPDDAVRLNSDIVGREGKIGVEVPVKNRRTIGLRELITNTSRESAEMQLPLRIGIDTLGSPVCVDLSQMPHLLVAGSTGSGKSIALNSLLVSLLYHASPEGLRLVLIDPKMVEFSHFRGLPHLDGDVITETDQTIDRLNELTEMMDERYRLLNESNSRNIIEFNELEDNRNKLSHMVVVIDELADLLMQEGSIIEDPIVRLAQKARAAGIHLIMATQRPTADIITGLIKTNVPGRLAFRVSSNVDSRVILNQKGAEALQGKGDGLFLNPAAKGLTRFQAPMVSLEEIERVTDFWKSR